MSPKANWPLLCWAQRLDLHTTKRIAHRVRGSCWNDLCPKHLPSRQAHPAPCHKPGAAISFGTGNYSRTKSQSIYHVVRWQIIYWGRGGVSKGFTLILPTQTEVSCPQKPPDCPSRLGQLKETPAADPRASNVSAPPAAPCGVLGCRAFISAPRGPKSLGPPTN